MTDPVRNTTMKLTPLGNLNLTGSNCTTRSVDVRNDEVRVLRMAYNNTGIYGLQFQTVKGLLFSYGAGNSWLNGTLARKTIEIDIKNSTYQNAFVGFEGTH